MSKKKKAVRKGPEKVISELDLELFKRLSSELLEARRVGKLVFDVLPEKAVISYQKDFEDTFLDRYKINKKTFSTITEALGNVLYHTVTDTEKDLLEEFKDKELVEKAKKMLIFANEKLDLYPEIRNRYFVVLYCKTRFLEDLDWEINLKTVQPRFSFETEEPPPVFPVCVLRLALRPQRSARRRVKPSEPELLTMELSLDDVITLVDTFSDIRERMRKLQTEKLTREGT